MTCLVTSYFADLIYTRFINHKHQIYSFLILLLLLMNVNCQETATTMKRQLVNTSTSSAPTTTQSVRPFARQSSNQSSIDEEDGYCGFTMPEQRKVLEDPDVSLFVLGGEFVEKIDYPYMALIAIEVPSDQNWCSFICGATIIDRLWLVTARHCVDHPQMGPMKRMQIAIPKSSNMWDCDFKDIDRVYKYRTNENRYVDNDVALIRLRKSIDFNDVTKPVKIAQHDPTSNEIVSALGWGTTDVNGKIVSNSLKKIDMRVNGHAQCRSVVGECYTQKNQFCVHINGTVCPGDSGGPAVLMGDSPVDDELIGVTSYLAQTPNQTPCQG